MYVILVMENLHTWEMIKHIEGVTLGPLLVSLGMSKFFTEHIESGKCISPEITNCPGQL